MHMFQTLFVFLQATSRNYRRIYKVKSREKTRRVRENWSQQLEHKQVTKWAEPGVWKGKRSLLACHTRCKCSVKTTRNSMKVKPGNKVIKLVKSLIGIEVILTGRGSEFHLIFVKD